MALVETCFCCSVPIASGFFAAYLLIAYLIAFAFELLWILESSIALPAAAVLLCAGFFAMALFAALLIHGLATKNTLCLIAWMFSITILTFPEAGLVMYMSIQYWRLETIYGITELSCWLIRIVVNVIELILIQSLYTMWKDEEMVVKRLRDLNMTAIPIPSENLAPLNSQYYQNNGYEHSMDHLNTNLKRFGSTPHIWNAVPNNMLSLPIEGYQYCTTQSEFNASIFMPTNYISNEMMGKKAQSLMDLRLLEEHSVLQENLTNQQKPWGTESLMDVNNYQIQETKSDSPRMVKCASMDALNNKNNHIIKNRTGFYAQPIPNYGVPIYYGPLDGPDFLIYKKQVDKLTSKNSLSNASADDVQKYRDVAL
ncbi:uncharacterized protein LOC109594441 [Aethina tumida]|uniref:uncharacterized protein LOC109594441 n=1 Tax=Aethina tumida TaxID=116153 RepID=UPI00096B6370|nr:uncharacterized protein LOC109594441 [Aethina tumida]